MSEFLVKWRNLHTAGVDVTRFNVAQALLIGVFLLYSLLCPVIWLLSQQSGSSTGPALGLRNITDVCGHELFVDGCTIPFNWNSPYRAVFRPSCVRHDVCYFCGSHYDWSRSDCDSGFFRDMLGSCTEVDTRQWLQCSVSAFIYYAAVKIFAGSYFEVISPLWCSEDCAKAVGNPNL